MLKSYKLWNDSNLADKTLERIETMFFESLPSLESLLNSLSKSSSDSLKSLLSSDKKVVSKLGTGHLKSALLEYLYNYNLASVNMSRIYSGSEHQYKDSETHSQEDIIKALSKETTITIDGQLYFAPMTAVEYASTLGDSVILNEEIATFDENNKFTGFLKKYEKDYNNYVEHISFVFSEMFSESELLFDKAKRNSVGKSGGQYPMLASDGEKGVLLDKVSYNMEFNDPELVLQTIGEVAFKGESEASATEVLDAATFIHPLAILMMNNGVASTYRTKEGYLRASALKTVSEHHNLEYNYVRMQKKAEFNVFSPEFLEMADPILERLFIDMNSIIKFDTPIEYDGYEFNNVQELADYFGGIYSPNVWSDVADVLSEYPEARNKFILRIIFPSGQKTGSANKNSWEDYVSNDLKSNELKFYNYSNEDTRVILNPDKDSDHSNKNKKTVTTQTISSAASEGANVKASVSIQESLRIAQNTHVDAYLSNFVKYASSKLQLIESKLDSTEKETLEFLLSNSSPKEKLEGLLSNTKFGKKYLIDFFKEKTERAVDSANMPGSIVQQLSSVEENTLNYPLVRSILTRTISSDLERNTSKMKFAGGEHVLAPTSGLIGLFTIKTPNGNVRVTRKEFLKWIKNNPEEMDSYYSGLSLPERTDISEQDGLMTEEYLDKTLSRLADIMNTHKYTDSISIPNQNQSVEYGDIKDRVIELYEGIKELKALKLQENSTEEDLEILKSLDLSIEKDIQILSQAKFLSSESASSKLNYMTWSKGDQDLMSLPEFEVLKTLAPRLRELTKKVNEKTITSEEESELRTNLEQYKKTKEEFFKEASRLGFKGTDSEFIMPPMVAKNYNLKTADTVDADKIEEFDTLLDILGTPNGNKLYFDDDNNIVEKDANPSVIEIDEGQFENSRKFFKERIIENASKYKNLAKLKKNKYKINRLLGNTGEVLSAEEAYNGLVDLIQNLESSGFNLGGYGKNYSELIKEASDFKTVLLQDPNLTNFDIAAMTSGFIKSIQDLNENFSKDLEEQADILATQQAASFPRSLTGVSSRVPGQGLQSWTSFKIAGFVSSNRNSVFTPNELLKVSGADFDIDKVHLLTYSIDPEGKIYGYSKFLNEDDNLDQNKFNKFLNSNIESRRTELNTDRLSYEEVSKIQEKSLNHFAEATKNYVVDRLREYIKDPKSSFGATAPMEMSDLEDIKRLKSQLNFLMSSVNNGKQIITYDNSNKDLLPFHNAMSIMDLEEINALGKDGIQFFANALKVFFTVYQHHQTVIDEVKPILDKPIEERTNSENRFLAEKLSPISFNSSSETSLINDLSDNPIAKEIYIDQFSDEPSNNKHSLYLKKGDGSLKREDRMFIGDINISTDNINSILENIKKDKDTIIKYLPASAFDRTTVENISQLLSAATDNAKELILGMIGSDNITSNTIATGVLMGHRLTSVIEIVTDPEVQEAFNTFKDPEKRKNFRIDKNPSKSKNLFNIMKEKFLLKQEEISDKTSYKLNELNDNLNSNPDIVITTDVTEAMKAGPDDVVIVANTNIHSGKRFEKVLKFKRKAKGGALSISRPGSEEDLSLITKDNKLSDDISNISIQHLPTNNGKIIVLNSGDANDSKNEIGEMIANHYKNFLGKANNVQEIKSIIASENNNRGSEVRQNSLDLIYNPMRQIMSLMEATEEFKFLAAFAGVTRGGNTSAFDMNKFFTRIKNSFSSVVKNKTGKSNKEAKTLLTNVNSLEFAQYISGSLSNINPDLNNQLDNIFENSFSYLRDIKNVIKANGFYSGSFDVQLLIEEMIYKVTPVERIINVMSDNLISINRTDNKTPNIEYRHRRAIESQLYGYLTASFLKEGSNGVISLENNNSENTLKNYNLSKPSEIDEFIIDFADYVNTLKERSENPNEENPSIRNNEFINSIIGTPVFNEINNEAVVQFRLPSDFDKLKSEKSSALARGFNDLPKEIRERFAMYNLILHKGMGGKDSFTKLIDFENNTLTKSYNNFLNVKLASLESAFVNGNFDYNSGVESGFLDISAFNINELIPIEYKRAARGKSESELEQEADNLENQATIQELAAQEGRSAGKVKSNNRLKIIKNTSSNEATLLFNDSNSSTSTNWVMIENAHLSIGLPYDLDNINAVDFKEKLKLAGKRIGVKAFYEGPNDSSPQEYFITKIEKDKALALDASGAAVTIDDLAELLEQNKSRLSLTSDGKYLKKVNSSFESIELTAEERKSNRIILKSKPKSLMLNGASYGIMSRTDARLSGLSELKDGDILGYSIINNAKVSYVFRKEIGSKEYKDLKEKFKAPISLKGYPDFDGNNDKLLMVEAKWHSEPTTAYESNNSIKHNDFKKALKQATSSLLGNRNRPSNQLNAIINGLHSGKQILTVVNKNLFSNIELQKDLYVNLENNKKEIKTFKLVRVSRADAEKNINEFFADSSMIDLKGEDEKSIIASKANQVVKLIPVDRDVNVNFKSQKDVFASLEEDGLINNDKGIFNVEFISFSDRGVRDTEQGLPGMLIDYNIKPGFENEVIPTYQLNSISNNRDTDMLLIDGKVIDGELFMSNQENKAVIKEMIENNTPAFVFDRDRNNWFELSINAEYNQNDEVFIDARQSSTPSIVSYNNGKLTSVKKVSLFNFEKTGSNILPATDAIRTFIRKSINNTNRTFGYRDYNRRLNLDFGFESSENIGDSGVNRVIENNPDKILSSESVIADNIAIQKVDGENKPMIFKEVAVATTYEDQYGVKKPLMEDALDLDNGKFLSVERYDDMYVLIKSRDNNNNEYLYILPNKGVESDIYEDTLSLSYEKTFSNVPVKINNVYYVFDKMHRLPLTAFEQRAENIEKKKLVKEKLEEVKYTLENELLPAKQKLINSILEEKRAEGNLNSDEEKDLVTELSQSNALLATLANSQFTTLNETSSDVTDFIEAFQKYDKLLNNYPKDSTKEKEIGLNYLQANNSVTARNASKLQSELPVEFNTNVILISSAASSNSVMGYSVNKNSPTASSSISGIKTYNLNHANSSLYKVMREANKNNKKHIIHLNNKTDLELVKALRNYLLKNKSLPANVKLSSTTINALKEITLGIESIVKPKIDFETSSTPLNYENSISIYSIIKNSNWTFNDGESIFEKLNNKYTKRNAYLPNIVDFISSEDSNFLKQTFKDWINEDNSRIDLFSKYLTKRLGRNGVIIDSNLNNGLYSVVNSLMSKKQLVGLNVPFDSKFIDDSNYKGEDTILLNKNQSKKLKNSGDKVMFNDGDLKKSATVIEVLKASSLNEFAKLAAESGMTNLTNNQIDNFKTEDGYFALITEIEEGLDIETEPNLNDDKINEFLSNQGEKLPTSLFNALSVGGVTHAIPFDYGINNGWLTTVNQGLKPNSLNTVYNEDSKIVLYGPSLSDYISSNNMSAKLSGDNRFQFVKAALESGAEIVVPFDNGVSEELRLLILKEIKLKNRLDFDYDHYVDDKGNTIFTTKGLPSNIKYSNFSVLGNNQNNFSISSNNRANNSNIISANSEVSKTVNDSESNLFFQANENQTRNLEDQVSEAELFKLFNYLDANDTNKLTYSYDEFLGQRLMAYNGVMQYLVAYNFLANNLTTKEEADLLSSASLNDFLNKFNNNILPKFSGNEEKLKQLEDIANKVFNDVVIEDSNNKVSFQVGSIKLSDTDKIAMSRNVSIAGEYFTELVGEVSTERVMNALKKVKFFKGSMFSNTKAIPNFTDKVRAALIDDQKNKDLTYKSLYSIVRTLNNGNFVFGPGGKIDGFKANQTLSNALNIHGLIDNNAVYILANNRVSIDGVKYPNSDNYGDKIPVTNEKEFEGIFKSNPRYYKLYKGLAKKGFATINTYTDSENNKINELIVTVPGFDNQALILDENTPKDNINMIKQKMIMYILNKYIGNQLNTRENLILSDKENVSKLFQNYFGYSSMTSKKFNYSWGNLFANPEIISNPSDIVSEDNLLKVFSTDVIKNNQKTSIKGLYLEDRLIDSKGEVYSYYDGKFRSTGENIFSDSEVIEIKNNPATKTTKEDSVFSSIIYRESEGSQVIWKQNTEVSVEMREIYDVVSNKSRKVYTAIENGNYYEYTSKGLNTGWFKVDRNEDNENLKPVNEIQVKVNGRKQTVRLSENALESENKIKDGAFVYTKNLQGDWSIDTSPITSRGTKFQKSKVTITSENERKMASKSVSKSVINTLFNRFFKSENLGGRILSDEEIVEEFGINYSGKAGFTTMEGDFIINEDFATLDTALHEFGGHIYLAYLKETDRETYEKIIDLALQDPNAAEILKNYPELEGDREAQGHEVFSTILGIVNQDAAEFATLNIWDKISNIADSSTSIIDFFKKMFNFMFGSSNIEFDGNESLIDIMNKIGTDIFSKNSSIVSSLSDYKKDNLKKALGVELKEEEVEKRLIELGYIKKVCL
jgi:hypothetical protein